MKKVVAILCCSAVMLTAGICVAYYNTRSLGFEENVSLFDFDNEKITFMDFDVYYKDVYSFIDKIGTVIPDQNRLICLDYTL